MNHNQVDQFDRVVAEFSAFFEGEVVSNANALCQKLLRITPQSSLVAAHAEDAVAFEAVVEERSQISLNQMELLCLSQTFYVSLTQLREWYRVARLKHRPYLDEIVSLSLAFKAQYGESGEQLFGVEWETHHIERFTQDLKTAKSVD